MKKQIFLFTMLFFFLQHCGYSPIYSNVDNFKFNFNVIEIQGNENMNNLVSSHIKKYSNNSEAKTYDLKIQTQYQKDILTKNKKGEATNFAIKTKIEFKIVNTNKDQIFSFEEEIKSTAINNQYELKKYENSIQSNFIKSKLDELILNLSINK